MTAIKDHLMGAGNEALLSPRGFFLFKSFMQQMIPHITEHS